MTETDASRQADLFASLKRGARIVLAAGTLLLAACQSIVPKGPAPVTPSGPTGPTGPDVTQGLPTDTLRHRVALLVPMSGPNAAVGQSIANATTLALISRNLYRRPFPFRPRAKTRPDQQQNRRQQ